MLSTAVALILAQTTPAVTLQKVVLGVRPLAFASAASGRRVVMTLEDGSARIFDPMTRQTLRTFPKMPQPAYGVAWGLRDEYIAFGDESARIWVYESKTGKRVREWRVHTRGIQKLSVNSNGSFLASTGKDDAVRFYTRVPMGKPTVTILGRGANLYGATWHPTNPNIIAAGVLREGVRVYNIVGTQVATFKGHGGQGVFDVAWSPKGDRLVSGGRDGNAIVWAYPSGKSLGTLRGHADWIVNVTYSPDGRYIATASTDRTVKVWDAKTLRRVADLEGQSFVGSPLCFTADSKFLLTVNDMGFLQVNAVR